MTNSYNSIQDFLMIVNMFLAINKTITYGKVCLFDLKISMGLVYIIFSFQLIIACLASRIEFSKQIFSLLHTIL